MAPPRIWWKTGSITSATPGVPVATFSGGVPQDVDCPNCPCGCQFNLVATIRTLYDFFSMTFDSPNVIGDCSDPCVTVSGTPASDPTACECVWRSIMATIVSSDPAILTYVYTFPVGENCDSTGSFGSVTLNFICDPEVAGIQIQLFLIAPVNYSVLTGDGYFVIGRWGGVIADPSEAAAPISLTPGWSYPTAQPPGCAIGPIDITGV